MPDTAVHTNVPGVAGPIEAAPIEIVLGQEQTTMVAEGVDADLVLLGAETAAEAREFLAVLRSIGNGESTEQAIPLLLLATSQILVTGARLGAITDVVPAEQFESDLGGDFDVEALRHSLGALLTGLDEYAEIVDPMISGEVSTTTLSGAFTEIASALVHGLRHYADGRVTEALWWWQFSYLSSWGALATGALRALQSILAHIRLDADEELVAEAEFDALYG